MDTMRRRLLLGLGLPALAGALLLLRQLGGPADPPAGAARPAAVAASAAASPPASATAPAAVAAPGSPARADAPVVIPPFASADEALASRDTRRATLPGVLQAMDAEITRRRGEIAALQGQAALRETRERELAQLLALRAQLLARNADVSALR